MKYLKGFNIVNEDIDSDGLSAQFPEEILLNFKEVKIQEDVHEIELKGSFLWNHRHNYDETMNESLGVWIGAGAAMGLLWLIRKLMKHVKDTNNSWNRHKFLQAINQTLSTLKSDDLYDTQEAFQITEYAQLYHIKANIDSEEIMPDIRIMKEKGIPASWVTKINDAGASEHDEVIKEKLSVYYLMFGNETIELWESEHKELVDKIKELLK